MRPELESGVKGNDGVRKKRRSGDGPRVLKSLQKDPLQKAEDNETGGGEQEAFSRKRKLAVTRIERERKRSLKKKNRKK